MSQHFRRVKIDPNDALYSKIVRTLAGGRCRRCHWYFDFGRLQCAHIMGRAHKGTRFFIEPKFNAIPLCANCHSWFDTHKIDALIFEEKKRVFKPVDESYTWLVSTKLHLNGIAQDFWNYTWEDLYRLYAIGHHRTTKYGTIEKTIVNEQLKNYFKKIS